MNRKSVEVFGSRKGLVWEQKDIPTFLSSNSFDIYFSGHNRGIPFRKSARTRYVLGLLDIIPYLFPTFYLFPRWKEFLLRPKSNEETISQLVSIARADAIVTISQQSARDIRRVFRRRNVTPHLIRLHDVAPIALHPPMPQFVYVGGTDARKRVDVLLHAFAEFRRDHPDYRLVLLGTNYASILPLVDKLMLGESVHIPGFVDHETKFDIIADSVAMVFPSLYEGYGMAIAEGLQAGIPVIAGQAGSQKEVGGDAVRPIDPKCPADIVAAMKEMLDPAIRNRWVHRGKAQLAHLTDPKIEADTRVWFLQQGRLARERATA